MSAENIILVTIDSLRADHCGFIDEGASDLTPAIDRLARQGVTFTKAFAPGPRTPSSIPVIATGEFHQYRDLDATKHWRELNATEDWRHLDDVAESRRRRTRIATHFERHRSVAQRLQQRGYATAAVTSNPWTARDTNFNAGFDEFVEVSGEDNALFDGDSAVARIDSVLKTIGRPDLFGWHNKREWFIQWENYYEYIEEIIDELDEPYFLWVFLLDCHQPYITPAEYRRESSGIGMYYSILRYWREQYSGTLPDHVERGLKRAYRDTIRSTDAFVDRLVTDTESDNPAVVLHADHGEAFGEHGTYGHEKQLYDVNLHVPFLVYNTSERGQINEQVSLQSMPEILVELANGTGFRPRSYVRDAVISTTEFDERSSVRGYGWKYIRESDDEELYDVRADPAEQRDVIHRYPEVANAFSEHLDGHRATLREKHRIVQQVSSLLD